MGKFYWRCFFSNWKYFACEWQVCCLKLLIFFLCVQVCVQICVYVCVCECVCFGWPKKKKKTVKKNPETPILWIMSIHYPLMNGGIYVNHFWHLMGEKLGNNCRQSERSGAPQWPRRLPAQPGPSVDIKIESSVRLSRGSRPPQSALAAGQPHNDICCFKIHSKLVWLFYPH